MGWCPAFKNANLPVSGVPPPSPPRLWPWPCRWGRQGQPLRGLPSQVSLALLLVTCVGGGVLLSLPLPAPGPGPFPPRTYFCWGEGGGPLGPPTPRLRTPSQALACVFQSPALCPVALPGPPLPTAGACAQAQPPLPASVSLGQPPPPRSPLCGASWGRSGPPVLAPPLLPAAAVPTWSPCRQGDPLLGRGVSLLSRPRPCPCWAHWSGAPAKAGPAGHQPASARQEVAGGQPSTCPARSREQSLSRERLRMACGRKEGTQMDRDKLACRTVSGTPGARSGRPCICHNHTTSTPRVPMGISSQGDA